MQYNPLLGYVILVPRHGNRMSWELSDKVRMCRISSPDFSNSIEFWRGRRPEVG